MTPTPTWHMVERSGIRLCVSRDLEQQPGLVHAFTTCGFNMSLTSGPDVPATGQRRRQLCAALNLDFVKLTGAAQAHHAEIVPVDLALAGAGRDETSTPVPHVDGFVTDTKGVVLMALSADCPLVLLFDPGRRALGVAHAGWRGTVACITQRLVGQMQHRFGSKPEALVAAVTPCAGPDRYEVQADVVRVAAARCDDYQAFFPTRDGRTFFDLRSANIAQLRASGVRADRIDASSICTISDDRFCSYRRDGSAGGHAALVAALT